MFFTKEEVALFGEDYITAGIEAGAIYPVSDTEFINAENLEYAINHLKIVEVRDVDDKLFYLKRDIALARKEKNELMIVQGTFVTAAYFASAMSSGKIIQCDTCGELLFKDKAVYTETGLHLCTRCANRSFAQCEDCGKWYPKSLVITIDGHKRCITCNGNVAYQCPHCHEWHLRTEPTHEVYVRGTLQIWCDHCYTTDTATCSDCGRTVPRNEISVGGRCIRCNEIYNAPAIRDYFYKPHALFFSSETPNGTELPENRFYYGVELETTKGRNQDFARALRSRREIYCKRDGSIGEYGAEVVTHPCSIDYHLTSGIWETVHDKAVEFDMRSHDTDCCGFHIHISRQPFIAAGIQHYDAEIALAIEKFKSDWELFARRRSEYYYAYFNRQTKSELIRVLNGANRYHSVNVNNAATVELRIFRGTLRVDTIKATLWAVDHICNRILNGWSADSAESFLDLFDMDNAPAFFKEYLVTRGLLAAETETTAEEAV